MKGKRRIDLASIWIIVIFTVIAVTLLGIFVLVYSSILNREMNSTLREEASVLSDNADYQILDPIRTEPARRLAARQGLSDTVQSVALKAEADSMEIQAIAGWCAAVSAATPTCDRVLLYFPEARMAVGSDGVHFLSDKKYAVRESVYSFLADTEPESMAWLRQFFPENGEEVPYIVYVGPMPGIFPGGKTPMIVSALKEEKLHTLLRRSLRTLTDADIIFLADTRGVIWSAADPSQVGATLPISQPGGQPCRLQDGTEVLLAESSSSASGFVYVLARPNAAWVRSYGSTFSLLVLLCMVLLGAGMIAVLWVLMTHYSRPMRRLIRHYAIPESKDKGSLVSSPSEHFSRIETALEDMSKIKLEQAQFLQQSRPVLRSAWLNCLICGEAHYTGPMPQLGIAFPYPFFQVVMLSACPDAETEEAILACFPEGFVAEAFTSREKERVFLINHGQEPDAVPRILRKAGEKLDEKNIPLTFGVGILAESESRVPVSFRCSRRALSSRYFGDNSRVSVFEPKEPAIKGEDAMPLLISRLYSLTSLIQRQAADEANEEIDAIVTQLKENPPYLNMMRSIMLTAAMFLCKTVYDMKSTPDEVFGDDLLNAYYHLEEINAFSSRLKEDSMTLIAYLSRESSESNRSVVQYAILHIQNANPAELSIQSIADALSISTGHLSRVFHQETGKKLVDYLQEVRMEHAARLIRENELTNEQVCSAVGYSRVQYFSAKFKEYYGVTVNEYRRRCLSGQDSPPADAAK